MDTTHNGIASRHVSLHAKVICLTALFLNSKHLFIQCFVSQLTGQHGIAVNQWSNLNQYVFVISLSLHCLRQNFNLYKKVSNLLLLINNIYPIIRIIKHKY